MNVKSKKETVLTAIRCYPEDKIRFAQLCKELNCTHAELMSALIGGFEERKNG